MTKKTAKKHPVRLVLRVLGWTVGGLFGLFLLLAMVIYLPPVQQFAQRQVCAALSNELGLSVQVERVRLAFPLDLTVDGVLAREGRDTVAKMDHLGLDVRLWPLLSGCVEVDGFIMQNVQLDTRSMVSDLQLRGRFGLLAVHRPVLADLKTGTADVDRIRIRRADFDVILGDTAEVDTTKTPTDWRIHLRQADLRQSSVRIRMPGDSMRILADINALRLDGGAFDLMTNTYAVNRLYAGASRIKYDQTYQPEQQAGLDPNHLDLRPVDVLVDTLRYADGTLRMGLRRLAFKDRSGVELHNLRFGVALDQAGVTIPGLRLKTSASDLTAAVRLPWGALDGAADMEVAIRGYVGRNDIMALAGDMAEQLNPFYPDAPLDINVAAAGSMNDLRIDHCALSLTPCVSLTLNGWAKQVMNDDRSGELKYNLTTGNLSAYQRIIAALSGDGIRLPSPMTLAGTVRFKNNDYQTQSALQIAQGQLTLDGRVNLKSEAYKALLSAKQLPITAFMPDLPITPLTASVGVDGRGFNVLASRSQFQTKLRIDHLSYDNYPLDSLTFTAALTTGNLTSALLIENQMINAQVNADADLNQTTFRADIQGAIDDLAMRYFTNDTKGTHVMGQINLTAGVEDEGRHVRTTGSVSDIHFYNDDRGGSAQHGLSVSYFGGRDTTFASMHSGDLRLHLASGSSLRTMGRQFGELTDTLMAGIRAARLNQQTLVSQLPGMDLQFTMGRRNPVWSYLNFSGVTLDTLYVQLLNEADRQLSGRMKLLNFRRGGLLLEDIQARLYEQDGGLRLTLDAINDDRRNPNKFSFNASGNILDDGASVQVRFLDEDRAEGLNLGLRAQIEPDRGVSIHFFPEVSTIAYRKFTINTDNYIALLDSGGVEAKVDLKADDGTGLRVMSETPDSTNQKAIRADLININLGELTNVLPYLPRLSGMLDGTARVLWQMDDGLTAQGMLQLHDFSYEDAGLGSLGMHFGYAIADSTLSRFNAQLQSEGRDVVDVQGTIDLADTSRVDAQLTLQHTPAKLLNSFVGADGTMILAGYMNGQLRMDGPLDAFLVNGTLSTDSLHILSPAYGMKLKVKDSDIAVANSRLQLDGLALYANDNNPLSVTGNVDFSRLANISLDVAMRASNFLLINSPRTKQSVVFGKVYVNLDATLKGTTDLMMLKGNLNVLRNSNVTYIMGDSPITVEDEMSGLVEFVDLSDTTLVDDDDSAPLGGMFMNFNIRVNEATHIFCELSGDGSSYVDCVGGGNFSLLLFPGGEMTLTGGFTMSEGEMKYTLPFIPLQTFKIANGSYVRFNGEVMNPTLNITATESVRASVNDEGNFPRMVNFNVGVAITQNLNNMGLDFLIDAPDDLGVQNDLTAMSKEDRSKVAISMLATGAYLTASNKSAFNATNALNAFLQSEIQSVAGNALKTVGLSVGMEGSTTSTGEQQTDYSFQFAKRFWGDRVTFKIGGKVSSGAETTDESQSFIDNISLEYRLGATSSRQLRLFYDNSNRDPFEGDYSSAGAGLMWSKKSATFGELFIRRKDSKSAVPLPKATAPQPETKADTTKTNK